MKSKNKRTVNPSIKTLLFLTNILFINAFSQVSTIKKIDLGGNGNDYAYATKSTIDGGFIVAGSSNSTTGSILATKGKIDFCVLKFNSNQQLEWYKTIGGNEDDIATTIEVCNDGGYIIAGYSNSKTEDFNINKGSYDIAIVKLDMQGNIQWSKTFGGKKYDAAKAIKATTDGGYIICGVTSSQDGDIRKAKGGSDAWLLKIDSLGNLLWEKTYGESSDESFNDIELTKEGGYLMAGYTEWNDNSATTPYGAGDFWIVKTSSTGEVEWEKTYGGANYDYASKIITTNDGGYLISGKSSSNKKNQLINFKGNNDFVILKMNATGDIIWENNLGANSYDIALAMKQNANGVISVIYEASVWQKQKLATKKDFWQVKFDIHGNVLSVDSLGINFDNFNNINVIEFAKDNGIIAVGNSFSDTREELQNGIADFLAIKTAPIILPLTNIQLSGEVVNDEYIALSWITNNEADTKYFNVERSTDGYDFKTIKQVEAKGAGQINVKYIFNDYTIQTLPTNHAFYRIKIVGKDNSFFYSQVIDLTVFKFLGHLKIYPMPTRSLINISGKNLAEAILRDANGKVLITEKINNKPNTIISVAHLNKGIYFLTLRQSYNDLPTITKKVIIE